MRNDERLDEGKIDRITQGGPPHHVGGNGWRRLEVPRRSLKRRRLRVFGRVDK